MPPEAQHVRHAYPDPAPRPPSPTYSDRPSRAPLRASRQRAFWGAGGAPAQPAVSNLELVGARAAEREARKAVRRSGGTPGQLPTPEEYVQAQLEAERELGAVERQYERQPQPTRRQQRRVERDVARSREQIEAARHQLAGAAPGAVTGGMTKSGGWVVRRNEGGLESFARDYRTGESARTFHGPESAYFAGQPGKRAPTPPVITPPRFGDRRKEGRRSAPSYPPIEGGNGDGAAAGVRSRPKTPTGRPGQSVAAAAAPGTVGHGTANIATPMAPRVPVGV
jgi:hypothetical protein